MNLTHGSRISTNADMHRNQKNEDPAETDDFQRAAGSDNSLKALFWLRYLQRSTDPVKYGVRAENAREPSLISIMAGFHDGTRGVRLYDLSAGMNTKVPAIAVHEISSGSRSRPVRFCGRI